MKAMKSSPAADWLTAGEIAARYIVGEATLLNYSRRGSLALRRGPDGAVRFDASEVARLFRPRDRDWAPLGVIGVSSVGDPLPGAMSEAPPPSTRRARRSRRVVLVDWTSAQSRKQAG